MSRVLRSLALLLLAWSGMRLPVEAAAAGPAQQAEGRNGYAGDDACRGCHATAVDTYHHTVHFLTSMPPTREAIRGSFAPGANLLRTANPALYFRMEARPEAGNSVAFYQSAVGGESPHVSVRSERFGIVVGSGEKGQTYLYWNDDQLFQLPVSWWDKVGWVNSPGYRDGYADFDRAIIPRCLECHATRFEPAPPPVNSYNTARFALGIQCEKCHGPGLRHVELERAGMAKNGDTAILNPARFTRQQQMDLCAWCHAGHGRALQPSFSYLPGQPLSQFIQFPAVDATAALDVHGNQVELLTRSLCYRSSKMTCITCHDVHVAQHDPAAFSERCLGCHKPESATFARPKHPVTKDCITCHMPRQTTNQIVFDFQGLALRARMVNHWIRVYPEQAAARP